MNAYAYNVIRQLFRGHAITIQELALIWFLPRVESLPDASGLLPQALDAMPFPVAAINGSDNRVIAANPAWDRLMVAADLPAARPWCLSDLFPDAVDMPPQVLWNNAAVSQSAVRIAPTSNGASPWWDLHILPHPDLPDVVLVTAHDVTNWVFGNRATDDAPAALRPVDAGLRLERRTRRDHRQLRTNRAAHARAAAAEAGSKREDRRRPRCRYQPPAAGLRSTGTRDAGHTGPRPGYAIRRQFDRPRHWVEDQAGVGCRSRRLAGARRPASDRYRAP